MNKYLIYKYATNITKEDIIKYSNSLNHYLTKEETNIIYNYIQNKTKEFIEGNPIPILNELKQKLSQKTYNIIIDLYNKYKGLLN